MNNTLNLWFDRVFWFSQMIIEPGSLGNFWLGHCIAIWVFCYRISALGYFVSYNISIYIYICMWCKYIRLIHPLIWKLKSLKQLHIFMYLKWVLYLHRLYILIRKKSRSSQVWKGWIVRIRWWIVLAASDGNEGSEICKVGIAVTRAHEWRLIVQIGFDSARRDNI